MELGVGAKIILETQRLILREMTQEDYPALAAILRDEQTMIAYEGAFSEAETQAWLDKNLARYRDDGIGLWAVILKDSGLMIGQAGLTWQDVNGRLVPEVGYLFNRAYWGKGYAIEAAIACKNYGFSCLGFNEIYTIVRDTNIASMNVAIRNGMVIRERFTKHYRGVDMPHYAFAVKKGDWEMIKVIGKYELRQALDLVNKVFSEFVAVDYSEQGKKTFSDYLQNKYDEVSADLLSGHKKIWGYYIDEKIVGVIAIRNITHIALMFVDKEYHKKGIARQLFLTALQEIKAHPNADAITVNSSPYAVKVYERLGFVKTGDMQEKDGILFIPMEFRI